MGKMKRTVFVLTAVLILISGAVTVYAMSGEAGQAHPAAVREENSWQAPVDYEAEEMAVGAYYQSAQGKTV